MTDMDDCCLSAAALAALKEFAQESGFNSRKDDDDDDGAMLMSINKFFEDPDKDDTFDVDYTSKDGRYHVNFSVDGVKRELGQTLDSTGLTIWRASEHLCEYIINNTEKFNGKSVCELGAGLGMVAILLGKLNVASKIVATDGDEVALELLDRNIDTTNTTDTVESALLYWGKLTKFQERYPEKFDIILAADVIYEECQVKPLVETVRDILSPNGEFLIAFARRNVPFDRVLEWSAKNHLIGTCLETGIDQAEPIYSFRFEGHELSKSS